MIFHLPSQAQMGAIRELSENLDFTACSREEKLQAEGLKILIELVQQVRAQRLIQADEKTQQLSDEYGV